jgi:hypothetical protein
MFRFSQMLNRGHKAFSSWVEEMFWDRSIVRFAPYLRVLGFLWGISSSLAETDEPWEILLACDIR